MGNKKLEVIKHRSRWFLISLCIVAVGLIFLIINAATGRGAFNYDVQFKGGTSFSIIFNDNQSADTNDIRSIVTEATGQSNPQIDKVLNRNEVNIVIQRIEQSAREELISSIVQKYSLPKANITYEDISPTISGEMQRSAITAVLAACLIILVYVSFRFKNLLTGASAILTLIHDVLIVVMAYAVFRIPLNYSFIAALLTILGYSINATIIIFDRIRENRSLLKRPTNEDLVNVSVSQTFRRCLYTSLTTLFTAVALFVLGVASIREFMMPIIVGIICGTYSSIFISGSIWYILAEGPAKALAKS